MPTATVTAQPLDAAFCPSDWQDVIDEFATKLAVTYSDSDEVEIDDSQPTDETLLWIEKNANYPKVRYAKVFSDSVWQDVKPRLYYTDGSAVADILEITTGYSMSDAGWLTDRLFIVKVANTNTGAVSVEVDSITSKALRKDNNTALVAGEIVAGQIIEFMYDPVAGVFELLSPVVAVASGVVTEYTSGEIAIPASGSAIPQQAHGISGGPNVVSVYLVAQNPADTSFTTGDRIPVTAVEIGVGADTDYHPFSVTWDATNVYVGYYDNGGTDTPRILRKDGTALIDLDTAKWKLKIHAKA